METRVAVLAIIVRDTASVPALNELLHQYAPYIIGRMGVPYHARGVNIISVAMDAPGDVISAEGTHRHGHGEADERLCSCGGSVGG